jgi:hypothetical protein
MTTPPDERYADLLRDGDPALTRLVGQLDQALQASPAPPQVRAALDHALQQRIAESQASRHPAPLAQGLLSRRDALKTAAASMAWLFSLSHVTPAIASELAHLAGDKPMTSARLAGILRTNRASWNALLAQVDQDRMEEPGVEGDWSVKELIAHLTWYEGRIVEGAQQVLSTGSFALSRDGVAALPMDERNVLIAGESRSRPLGEVLSEAERVFDQLMAVVAACPDNILNDAQLLGLPDDIAPWMRVANNSYAYYREHEQSIRAWLDRAPPLKP